MKFSIVTPVYNGESYIDKTIESVLSQKGNFDIEYIIQDGGSNDRTMQIVLKYDKLLKSNQWAIGCKSIELKIRSEKDKGMYDAINKGFEVATGDIYAWINADDTYLACAFDAISRVFVKFPEIQWLKGITSFMNKNGMIYEHGQCLIYNQDWIRLGIYGRNAYFIHQDSVFWRKELWQKSHGTRSDMRLAGDYALWIEFSRHTSLWSVNQEVSCFRNRPEQLSSNMDQYRDEQKRVSQEKGFIVKYVKAFFWFQSKCPKRLNNLFLKVYNILFIGKNRYFVDITSENEPIIKKTYSYIVL